MHLLAPDLLTDGRELSVPVLAGGLLLGVALGLLGVYFFRAGTMALTSLVGTLLVEFCTLCLLDRAATLKCVPWADANAVLLNWLCGSGTILGVLAQFLLERRRVQKRKQQEEA